MQRVIVTGLPGQDASVLTRYLLTLPCRVWGVYRRTSSGKNFSSLEGLIPHPHLELVAGDICDYTFINQLVKEVKPFAYVGLAAQSHVHLSFTEPIETFRIDGEAVIGQLETIRQSSPETRFYNAASSELFGGLDCPTSGYTEGSPLHPRSPYACAKAAAFYATRNYREAYGLHVSSGILFNHSSVYRGSDFATRKITLGVAKIKAGIQDRLYMGNMDACRDEGHALDYMKAAWLILQQDRPDDYVVATGVSTSIQRMLEYACYLAGLKYEDVYREDPRFMRPSDVPFLLGDSTKIRTRLGWEPQYTWQALITEMLENDCKLVAQGKV